MSTMIVPKTVYVWVWLALMLLLAATWGVAQFNLGPFNVVAALTIAAVKMMLVILYFMHVRYATRVTWVFVAAGLIWFVIMVDLTMSDYLTRGASPGTRQSWRLDDPGHPPPSGPAQQPVDERQLSHEP